LLALSINQKLTPHWYNGKYLELLIIKTDHLTHIAILNAKLKIWKVIWLSKS